MDLNQSYWQTRWAAGTTGWDVGHITPPIKDFIDQLPHKRYRILVPGAGSGHEAAYLWQNGFKNTHVCEWSAAAKAHFGQLCPDFPESQWWSQDFFELSQTFDIIIEQTFFCALNPVKRPDYAKKMFELLDKNTSEPSRLVGLLFNRHFEQAGPPFGGTAAEYRTYFDPYFSIAAFDPCLTSVPPRLGSEIWIDLRPNL